MKKFIALFLTLLFCVALSLNAYADLWIPPVDDGGYCQALVQISGTAEAEPLNRLASELLRGEVTDQNVFAYAERWVEYRGDREYSFIFAVYQTTADPETCYALEDPKSAENAQWLCNYSVLLTYLGDTGATQFEASDFTVKEYSAFPAVVHVEDYIDDVTLSYIEVTEATETVESEPLPSFETVTETGTPADEALEESGFRTSGTILLTAGVAVLALGTGLAIALIFRKKR